MAVQLLAYVLADLCLGKPPLRSLSASSTVADALAALRSSGDSFISVWRCDHRPNKHCLCIGKVSVVNIICYLCRDENLDSPAIALKAPVSALLPEAEGVVRHVDPSSSLLEAIDLILQGTQNLVLPIKCSNWKRKHLTKSSTPTWHNGQEFCWLTQEDIVRFLLSSIGLFSPIPTLSIDALGIISRDFMDVGYHAPASSAVAAIARSLKDQTSVAVVDEAGTLIGEISPVTLACCDETVSAAIMSLSAGDLMAYIDCGGPPDEIVRLVEQRLKERGLDGMLEEFIISTCGGNSTSSDEELPSPTTRGRSIRMVRRAEAIVCHPGSSVVAVMIQAIAHRVNYMWVIEEDGSVGGMVTFASILGVFRDSLESWAI